MQPKTLQQAVQYFGDPNNCVDYMAHKRWPDGIVVCPTCGRNDVSFLANQRKWQCKSAHAKRQFSAKVGTIFEDSPIPLEKWLIVVWMVCNCKNGVSSYEIAKAIGVTQKSAWFMLHRIRVGLSTKRNFGAQGKLGGANSEVECDEAWIGGKVANMHKERRSRYQAADTKWGKVIVMGMLDRTARQIRTEIIPNVDRDTLQSQVLNNVKYGTKVYTDSAPAYSVLARHYIHDFVNHAEEYVNGRVHTNGLENFWSLFKRNLRGTYVSVEPFHMFRYLDEQVFRFNNRGSKDAKVNDLDRFNRAMGQVFNKRLTYVEVTGKNDQTTPF
jgi:transposase-like protein